MLRVGVALLGLRLRERSARGGDLCGRGLRLRGDGPALQAELLEIAAQVKTASGAPKADSAALRAGLALNDTAEGHKHAAEMLTIGLSAAE